jgi:23S rRNA pseudouridine1911/1915/1917 synthase
MQVYPVKKSATDQEAILKYKIIGQLGETQCWGIELITGRRHQIRAQLAYIGCPIQGDRRYGQLSGSGEAIALHCVLMCFLHPIKKEFIQVFDNPDTRTSFWKDYKTGIQDWVNEMRKKLV